VLNNYNRWQRMTPQQRANLSARWHQHHPNHGHPPP
jgi:hypothetical protein